MKYTLSGLVIIILLSACGIFKSSPERPEKRPPSKVEEKAPEKEEKEEAELIPAPEDTVVFKEDTVVSEVVEEEVLRLKDQYNIRILLPLLPLAEKTAEEENEDKEVKMSSWNASFMEYLAGFKLGLKNYLDSNPDFSYRLSVISSEDMDRAINEKDSMQLEGVDVLLGGVTQTSLNKISDWAVEKDKVFISPWVPFSPISQNHHYIQLSPNLQQHCNTLSEHLMGIYDLKDIFIVVSSENADRVDCFNKYFSRHNVETSFQTIELESDFELEDIELLSETFSKEDTNIIVVPESSNKAFIHSLISKLSVLKDMNFIIVGLQGWLKYDLLHNYFEKMPFVISVDQFIGEDSLEYLKFEELYFQYYHDLPTDWSVKGYDHGIFTAAGLHKFGLDLPLNLSNIHIKGIGTDFSFDPFKIEQSSQDSLYDNVNNAVQIIKYKQHEFHKVRE